METPTDHVAELVRLAEALEKSAAWFDKPGASKLGTLYARRAAAIRWILAETAHGCDPEELPQ